MCCWKYTSVSHTGAASDWPCNTRSGAITLNVALAEWPVESLEYVLVHELVHLWEASHGPRFTARMDEYLLGWRQRRAALKGR